VALGIDRSWSMAGEPLRLSKQASRAFLRTLRPSDRSFVLSIGAEAEEIAAIGVDRAVQDRAIAALDPWGTTALYDASIAALDRLDAEPGRQAFVVFSDGTDRYSRASVTQVMARARRSRALVYPIAFGRARPEWLAELAVVTGGRSFHLRDVRGLDATLTAIAQELRQQYLLGYVPAASISRPGAWHSIRVTVTGRPGLRVRSRDGYEAR
jgi:Ca-activated chloride channel family protein